MNPQPAHIRQSHVFHLLGEPGACRVAGDLEYCRAEPYMVSATFRVGAADGVEWLFARDLLIEGMIRPAGDGDIHIAPDESDADTIIVELRSPNGRAVLTAAASALAEFLSASYAMVGVGTESDAIDIDTELVVLLANDSL